VVLCKKFLKRNALFLLNLFIACYCNGTKRLSIADSSDFSHQCLYLITGALEEIYMFGLGWPEIAVISIVAVLIFGPKKIPELGTALGKTLRGFKEEMKTPSEESNQEEEKQ
jgi:sec-independent protein translocase protein TatA